MEGFRRYIYDRHDVYCNQKYGDDLPYSFHLKAVEAQGEKFLYLIHDYFVTNEKNHRSTFRSIYDIIRFALLSHDANEDARMTYNNILEKANEYLGNYTAAEMVANIVYCVTDEKGKTRSERKNDKYYSNLKENRLAIFVKLADLSANTIYSKLTCSNMYEKYKSEFPKFKEKLFIEEYKEFFDYVENL